MALAAGYASNFGSGGDALLTIREPELPDNVVVKEQVLMTTEAGRRKKKVTVRLPEKEVAAMTRATTENNGSLPPRGNFFFKSSYTCYHISDLLHPITRYCYIEV